MRFFLNFKSDSKGKVEIVEPFEFEKITFSLKQKPNGMGRDMAFGADKNMLEFTDQADHQLKQLLYYNRRFGFESDVELTIEVDDENKYICNLDFKTADTDGLTYFKCSVMEDSKLQIINTRLSTKVNLFANTDIDGNYIEPLVGENMLILAKPVYQTSQWKDDIEKTTSLVAKFFMNFARNQTQYEIDNSYVPFVLGTDDDGIKDNPLIEFQDNSTNITLRLNLRINGYDPSLGNNISLAYFIGSKADFNPNSSGNVIGSASDVGGLTYNGEINIASANRGDFVWIYAFMPFGSPVVQFTSHYYDVIIRANTINYNSVAKSIRLIDVMRQVIKSISGLQITAPAFDVGGLLYDNRLVDGNLLRGINDRAFSVSLEDIEKSLTEFKADFEIGSDGKVFFGLENEFYRNEEMMFFPATQFSEMHETYNPKYTVNEFHYLYKNFQSKKENEVANSSDTIHGESKYSFFAKKVENKKVVEIEWVRDAFLIEEARGKALEISTKTSYQDDDSLFAIDSINTLYDVSFIESSKLEHTKDLSNNRLVLRNDGSNNFIVLGIVIGSDFVIQTPDTNAGAYTVYSVSENQLELTKNTGTISGAGNGVRQTVYRYTLKKEDIPFTNYTNQGFTETENLNADFSYSNRRYSIRSNIDNFWNSYLAAANLYWKDKSIKNFWYKNNPEYTFKYGGVKVIEGSEINPTNPIVTPVMYEDIVFSDVEFSDFIILTNKIRSIRGYIRAIDNNFRVIKLFPVDVVYNLKDKLLSIKAEQKHEPTSMTITTDVPFITINNETRVLAIDYEIKDNEVFIYDETRQLLYNPVYWMEISINGAIPPNIATLKTWLDLLTTP